MAVVIPTGRPNLVRNGCVIKVLVAFLCCPLVFEFSVGIGVFVIGLIRPPFFLTGFLNENDPKYDFLDPKLEICICG